MERKDVRKEAELELDPHVVNALKDVAKRFARDHPSDPGARYGREIEQMERERKL